jgi:tetratricopeptide (TPR) repeat protein
MIVRNESANLPACLESAADLVDEIVVVDTGSTDDTREIATHPGARVYEFPWCDDFAAARNESLRRANGDWILWLDADDRVPMRGRAGLKELIRDLPDENVAFLMDILCPGPDGGPMLQGVHPRLFRRREDIRWVGRVHEQIASAVMASGGTLRKVPLAIVHLGYMHGGNRRDKLERNLRLIDLQMETSGMDVAAMMARAGTLVGLERGAEALVALNLCASLQPPPPMAREAAALEVEAWVLEDGLHEALAAARSGLARFPRDTSLQFQEAALLAALGELEEAETCLLAQLIVGEEHAGQASADRTIAAFRAQHLLAEVLLERGRADLAEPHASAVVRTRSGYGQGWITLAEALASQGKWAEVARVRSHVETTLQSPFGSALVQVWCHLARGETASALAVLDAARTAGTSVERRFVSKVRARVLLSAGDRGDELRAAVRAILAEDRLCLRTRAIARALAGGGRPRWCPRDPVDSGLTARVL